MKAGSTSRLFCSVSQLPVLGLMFVQLFFSGVSSTLTASVMYPPLCLTPTAGQRHTLEILAQKVDVSYSPESCSTLYGKLRSVRELQLDNKNIEDISPLSPLTRLEKLTLDFNRIEDLTPLGGLTHLRKLFLVNNRIQRIDALDALRDLKWLYISYNQISDLSPLRNLRKLTHFYGSDNQIVDLTPLRRMTQLSWLILSNNKIKKITPLKRLKWLKRLDLRANEIQSLAPIWNFRFRRMFNLPKSNRLARETRRLNSSITRKKLPRHPRNPPVGMKNQTTPAMSPTTMNQTDAVIENREAAGERQNAPQVDDSKSRKSQEEERRLIASIVPREELIKWKRRLKSKQSTLPKRERKPPDTSITEPPKPIPPKTTIAKTGGSEREKTVNTAEPVPIPQVPAETAFMSLCLSPSKEQRVTLEILARKMGESYSQESCENLRQKFSTLMMLIIHDTDIRDVSPLVGLENLKWLFLYNNQIENIAPLRQLKKLEALGLNNNRISDITPLQNLTRLRTLSLHNNRIMNIVPLGKIVNLKTLSLHNNQIQDITPLKRLNKLESLKLNNNLIQSVVPLSGLARLSELHLKENRITDIVPLKSIGNLKKLDLRMNDIEDLTPLRGLSHYTSFKLPRVGG